MLPEDDDSGKSFFTDLLRHIAASEDEDHQKDEPFVTARDVFHGTREDVSTESGVTVSDESSLLIEARPSPIDMSKQKEVVSTLVKFFQVSSCPTPSYNTQTPILPYPTPSHPCPYTPPLDTQLPMTCPHH